MPVQRRLRYVRKQLDQLLHPAIDPDHGKVAIAKGLPASPGAAVGEVVFDADTAAALGEKGESVVLVRYETTPDDIHGLIVAQGILTAHGGMVSHAAVVARGWGKCCIVGCHGLKIDERAGTMSLNGEADGPPMRVGVTGRSGRTTLLSVSLKSR